MGHWPDATPVDARGNSPAGKSVKSWDGSGVRPQSFGFPTELWTAARTAQVIYRKWRIKFHPRYLSQWLAERRITPQKPRFQAPRARRRRSAALAARGVAADKKSAARRRAYLVLIDESGFLLSPLVRRTLAPRGQTPVLKTWGGHRERVSATAALTISPRRRRLGLYFCTYPKTFRESRARGGFSPRPAWPSAGAGDCRLGRRADAQRRRDPRRAA